MAYQVGDTNQYVQVPDSILSGLSQFTMSGWIKPGQLRDKPHWFVRPKRCHRVWLHRSGHFQYLDTQWRSGLFRVPPHYLAQDAWYHVAVVGGGTNMQLYINGGQMVAQGGSALGGTYGASGYNLNMGGGGVWDPTGNQLVGTIDEVAFWDVALGDDEVEALYNAADSGAPGDFAQAVLATNPLGYWRLNEEEGTVAANIGSAGEDLNGVYNAGFQGDPDRSFPVSSRGTLPTRLVTVPPTSTFPPRR